MAINIIWSTANGGAAITSPISLGTATIGVATSATQIFIRHSGFQTITGCRLFIQPYSANDFEGIATPYDNYEELTEAAFNPGLQININSAESFPEASWQNVTTAVGSSSSTGFDLGTIPAGDTPGVSFKVRFSPLTVTDSNEDTGKRQFDFKLSYLTTE